ncbi:class II aldolase/adducin family protein [Peptoniphilus equinus]|uniref:Class II aldolase/adducin family protein n=1 Tax=Peptoniphilus equinus TaxID=3016343 RepID=A0ABY7QRZ5_9FIRM|nr:class II aldolase/adducin family protein [Peptoniphilus equinus]WBW49554.1 class II aldolase/adducin family protein [Peptoniphilus equinus]
MNYRKALVDAGRRMYETKLVAGTSGNISIKENDNSFYITPSGRDYMSITEADIVRIDREGKPFDSAQVPSSEWRMHLEVYKTYPHYRAIIHTHSTFATVFSIVREDIPLISIEMKPFIGGELRVAPFAEAGSLALAQKILPYLATTNSCLLANHGAISCGVDLDSAFTAAEYVEDLSKLYYYARTVGHVHVIGESC